MTKREDGDGDFFCFFLFVVGGQLSPRNDSVQAVTDGLDSLMFSFQTNSKSSFVIIMVVVVVVVVVVLEWEEGFFLPSL